MEKSLSPNTDCYKSENYPYVVARSHFCDFNYLQNGLGEDFVKDTLEHFNDLINSEGKFCESVVEIDYNAETTEQYPYFGTFDFEDVEKLKRKFPTARAVRVYNLKYFREMYFESIFDNET